MAIPVQLSNAPNRFLSLYLEIIPVGGGLRVGGASGIGGWFRFRAGGVGGASGIGGVADVVNDSRTCKTSRGRGDDPSIVEGFMNCFM